MFSLSIRVHLAMAHIIKTIYVTMTAAHMSDLNSLLHKFCIHVHVHVYQVEIRDDRWWWLSYSPGVMSVCKEGKSWGFWISTIVVQNLKLFFVWQTRGGRVALWKWQLGIQGVEIQSGFCGVVVWEHLEIVCWTRHCRFHNNSKARDSGRRDPIGCFWSCRLGIFQCYF